MRIDRVNKMNAIYKNHASKAVKGTAFASEKDSFDISSVGKDMQVAKKALSQVSEIRMDKVTALKEKIKSGQYNVGAQEVADKLVDNYFDAKI